MVADRHLVRKVKFYCLLIQKSTFLLLFGSDINAWKTNHSANSVPSPLSLFPELSSSLLKRFEESSTDFWSEKSNFIAFWNRKPTSLLLFQSYIKAWKGNAKQTSVSCFLSTFPQNSLLPFWTVLSGRRQSFCLKSRILGYFAPPNQQFCCYLVRYQRMSN